MTIDANVWQAPEDGTEPVPPFGSVVPGDGYRAEEWLIEGRARSWRETTDWGTSGRWDLELDDLAPFRTRLSVCRPVAASRFSGTVVVEWLNVSAGADVSPLWFYAHRYLERTGAAWVGVSAQRAGIEGGGIVTRSDAHLKAAAPERYASLNHPGDRFAFDVFAQSSRQLTSEEGPFAGLQVDTLLAAGESQSAMFLLPYVNAIEPMDPVFDGYLLLGCGGQGASIDGRLDLPIPQTQPASVRSCQRIRRDAPRPVLLVQSETDVTVLRGADGRQPDGPRLRTWEIAGAAHFDAYGLIVANQDDGSLTPDRFARLIESAIDLNELFGISEPMNWGLQQHYVLHAAIAWLERWAQGLDLPPTGSWLRCEPGTSIEVRRARDGIAIGGVRTPWVDAPTSVLSGRPQTETMPAALFGSTLPFSDQELATRYPDGRTTFLDAFSTSLEATIAAGFILEGDRHEILAVAAAQWPG